MIGVIANSNEQEIVSEFFELFKTPWEFFDRNKTYDVVINTTENFEKTNAKLVLLYNSGRHSFDSNKGISTSPIIENKYLQDDGFVVPVYRNLSVITGSATPRLTIRNNAAHAGQEFIEGKQRIVRIGYDLFQEVTYLLSNGQPAHNASIPTLELHIATLRRLILQAGISFVEIPPVPAGYNFIVCLTHDIDFIRIRDHRFDHTMWGFLYRASIGTLINVLNGRSTLADLYQNWKAVLTVPFVYLGLAIDFWFKFDRYMELEEKVGARSTFFFIPFKNRMGDKLTGKGAKMRAAKYDVTDIQDTIKKLVNNGFEAGVHGIDAWHDPAGARAEKARITEASGQSDVGIRMHWLYYNQDTHRILEEAGYTYDTTFGYNDAVGYRAGTTQIFKPISVNNILELPLNIQDTALFNPRHMSLTKAAAWHLVDDLISKTMVHGGVLTVLWHDRSLSPERLYEDFYIKLLDELKSKNVWFATAIDVCNWFKVRRATRFENVTQNGNVLHIKISNEKNDYLPSMMLRVYQPNINKHTINYTDLPWQNQTDFSINV
jgi:peptidoglycan/xylan/chitin deacetylase (PgdA/CDA1 family)